MSDAAAIPDDLARVRLAVDPAMVDERLQQIIADHLPADTQATFRSADIAARVLEWIGANDPGFLEDLARSRIRDMVRQSVNGLLRERRSVFRRDATRAQMAAAVDRAVAGDPDAGSVFRSAFVVDHKSTRRYLGDMTGEDHEFVAGRYERSAGSALMRAAFHRWVAAKVGASRTVDVFTEAEYQSAWVDFVEQRQQPTADQE